MFLVVENNIKNLGFATLLWPFNKTIDKEIVENGTNKLKLSLPKGLKAIKTCDKLFKKMLSNKVVDLLRLSNGSYCQKNIEGNMKLPYS